MIPRPKGGGALAWVTMMLAAALTGPVRECRATQVLVSNTSAASPAIRDYSEVEVELTYSGSSTRVTGMRFWYPSGLTGTTTATLRDGDGRNTGVLVGVPVRNDGAFTVYEFAFSGLLGPRSQYYAAYAFTNSGTAIGIGTTATSAVTFDAAMLAGASYAILVPDPTDSQSTTFGQYPRFEVVGVPEPQTVGLAFAAATILAWRRRTAGHWGRLGAQGNLLDADGATSSGHS